MKAEMKLTPDDIRGIVVQHFESRGYTVDPASFRLNVVAGSSGRMNYSGPKCTGATVDVQMPERVDARTLVDAAEKSGGWGR